MNATNCEHTHRPAVGFGLCNTCYQRQWRTTHRHTMNIAARHRTRKIRLEMIEAYGGMCICCGEDRPEFLTIDHTNGGGSKERREFGEKIGTQLYRKLKSEGWPKDKYRLLCFNCNSSYGTFGYCPHQSPELSFMYNKRVQEPTLPRGPKPGEMFRKRFTITVKQRAELQRISEQHVSIWVRQRAMIILHAADSSYELSSDQYKRASFWADRYLIEGVLGLDKRRWKVRKRST